MNPTTLEVSVERDPILTEACRSLDYELPEVSRFELPKFPAPARDGSWSLGLVVGPSGSGKSKLLQAHYGAESPVQWDEKRAVVSHFPSAKEGIENLTAVGFNSIPAWARPYHVLSMGEKFRATLARGLLSNSQHDEFSSVVDRMVAKSVSVALRRHIDRSKLTGVVLASCHYDIVEWLCPDWVFDTATGALLPRGSLPGRPRIHIDLVPGLRSAWKVFAPHHYLTGSLCPGCRVWVAYWGDYLVGFVASMPLPSGTLKNAWREHRLVVLPDFQGLGIGIRISNAVARMHVIDGKRYYGKTTHPRVGAYRDAHPSLWRPSRHNHRDYGKVARHRGRPTWTAREGTFNYCHEWVGNLATSASV